MIKRCIDYFDCIYLLELKLTDTTNTARSSSYLERYLFNYRDDFNFNVVNCPFICSHIPAAPADGEYVSLLKWFSASWRFPSWIWLCFIETVSRINTDMFGLYLLQVISLSSLMTCHHVWHMTGCWCGQHHECHLWNNFYLISNS